MQTYKRVISLFIILTLMCTALLTACSKDKGEATAENTTETTSVQETSAEVYDTEILLKSDTAAPLPGSEFTIAVSVKHGEMFCYTDLYITYDTNVLQYVSYENADIDDLQYEVEERSSGTVYYAAYVARTLDITSDELVKLKFKVLDTAQSGARCDIGFTADCQYAIGEDVNGDKTRDISDYITMNGCTVTIG